jgi:hypothetical protein
MSGNGKLLLSNVLHSRIIKTLNCIICKSKVVVGFRKNSSLYCTVEKSVAEGRVCGAVNNYVTAVQ